MLCVSFTMSCSRSGMPSPVMALVGTTLTKDLGSGFFQYSATLRPCSFSCVGRGAREGAGQHECMWVHTLAKSLAQITALQHFQAGPSWRCTASSMFPAGAACNLTTVRVGHSQPDHNAASPAQPSPARPHLQEDLLAAVLKLPHHKVLLALEAVADGRVVGGLPAVQPGSSRRGGHSAVSVTSSGHLHHLSTIAASST